ncbi:MAG: homing endonuclease associated repeat-containing protein [Rhodospirillales bacterium]
MEHRTDIAPEGGRKTAPGKPGAGAPIQSGKPTFELPYLLDFKPGTILAEIKRVAGLVDHRVLSIARFERHARVDRRTIQRRFGTWRQALEAAGLGHRFSGQDWGGHARLAGESDDKVLEAIRALAREKRRNFLHTRDFRGSADLSLAMLRQRFGSVAHAVARADLGFVSATRKRGFGELHANLLAVWRHYGRAPTLREMTMPPSTIKATPYLRHWRTWKRTLDTFVKRMKDDKQIQDGIARDRDPEAEAARRFVRRLRLRDKKDVPLSLRFQVLRRDRFRCVACGASPAEDPRCKLHVDHIAPFSRGGKTEPGNLRTLCAACNLGRGAREGDT